jgi:hypothetical protein
MATTVLRYEPKLYTDGDCLPESEHMDWNDCLLILKPDRLPIEQQLPPFQLWKGDGGFGCTPGTDGDAVFAISLVTGERRRWRRSDFYGVLKPAYQRWQAN